jgi:hypothetical protein
MKNHETWDDRYSLINHPYFHMGVVSTILPFAAGVDSGAAVILAKANIVVTLPPASTGKGKAFYIKKAHAVAGAVTITPTGTDTIDGAALSVTITTNMAAVLLISDGTGGWWIIADKVAVSPF